jgi:LmbE family N-acetylglucosaminyl deacetylase
MKKYLGLILAAITLCCSPLVAQKKSILVFAPHPDDEALMASGVIYSHLQNGDTVNVVMMTSGDSGGSVSMGLTREAETVAGMGVLGLHEPNVIFLGYGDGSLMTLYSSSSPTQVYTSAAGQTQTYASRGLGSTDYHNFLNGQHGAYNQATLLQDIEAVLQNTKPDEIYTTISEDTHPDHAATYLFVAEAIQALRNGGSTLAPKLFGTFVWAPGYINPGGNVWPMPPAFAPGQPLSPVPNLSATPLDGNGFMNFPVPAAMQDPNPTTNLKNQTISQYPSQTGGDPSSWFFGFVKKNEMFWERDFATNVASNASVSVSSFAGGQPGTAAVDGVVDGYIPSINGFDLGHASAEWVSNGELTPWIQLNWAQPITTSLIVLHDRPNPTDNVQAGTLTFSDGSSISVGALPINGDGLLVPLGSPKTISSLKFTVTQGAGLSVGLAEIEVYGLPAGSANNPAPDILIGPVATPNIISNSQTSNLSVAAIDVEGSSLQYSWSADGGTVVGSGATAVFTPPSNATANSVFTITASITDASGNITSNSTFVTVSAATTLSLSSVTLNPATVTGGTATTGTATLSSAAPAGGAVITLSSNNTAAAAAPASVTVAAGATKATFAITTSAVGSTTALTISATYNGTQTATLTVNPPTLSLSSVTLSPATVTGGTSTTGTVKLGGAAPAGGAVVTLSSSNSATATVPASVTVAAGATTATFAITTSAVGSATALTISATYNGTRTATLTVNPPTLSSVTLSPATVAGGTSTTGMVKLSSAAPAGGMVVTLSSSNTAVAKVPTTATVAAGESSITFAVSTNIVIRRTSITVSAVLNSTTKQAALTVNFP